MGGAGPQKSDKRGSGEKRRLQIESGTNRGVFMSESIITKVLQLSVPVEALAALGAELRALQEHLDVDPRVRALLQDAVGAIGPQLLDGLKPAEAASALALVQTVFRQALDVLENPTRAPGWSYDDRAVLQTQGQVSRVIVHRIDALAKQHAPLAAALRAPGVFLDVGTGVGWLAIEAARTWPALKVWGLDPWEPALALARENLAHSNVADRVTFRQQRVAELEEVGRVTVAWVPGPFFAREVVDRALASVVRALRPGGWLVFGLTAAPADSLADAVVRLRTLRSGGHSWTADEVVERLRQLEFTAIEAISPGPPVHFVLAQRPVDAQKRWFDAVS
jgi:SAM-dependent methyltransferase